MDRQLESEPAFDEILVSPSPRAMYTIAPYLRGDSSKGHDLAASVRMLYRPPPQRRKTDPLLLRR